MNDGPTWVDVTDLVLKVLAGLAAVYGFRVAREDYRRGRRDYRQGQRWQKAQILLSLIDAFEGDKKITCACSMLDWDAREVTFSEGKLIHFKNEMLITALRVPETNLGIMAYDGPEAFTTEEAYIRDCFDAFFDFFHKLYAFWKSGLLSLEDYAYFRYWFGIVHYLGEYKGNDRIKQVMEQYIKSYGFMGFAALLREYEKNPDPIMDLSGKGPAVEHR